MTSLRHLFHPRMHIRGKAAFVVFMMVIFSSFISVMGVSAQSGDGGLGVGTGHGPEVGINVDALNQIKADIASGMYNRPCTQQEHDRHKWHALVDPVLKCHYDHHHGDDPNYVNDIFGSPGAWFGVPGQSVSYPWQTFPARTPSEGNEQYVAQGVMENDLKHEGYMWLVRRDQPCPDGNCVTDLRVQYHGIFGAHDATVRFHSYSFEVRVCRDKAVPSSCGIIRTGGWMDTGKLFITDGREPRCTNNNMLRISLPADSQFFPLDEASPDEMRCHAFINDGRLPAYPPQAAISEWWVHSPGDRARFQIFAFDPIGNIRRDDPATWDFYCEPGDVNCRYNQSILSGWIGYVLKVYGGYDPVARRYLDLQLDANQKINVRTFTRRMGDLNLACTTTSLDCIPLHYEGVYMNTPQYKESFFAHSPCRQCPKIDHDLSPAGQLWNTWFFTKYGVVTPPTPPPPPPPPPAGPSIVIEVDPQTANPGDTVNVSMGLYNVTDLYGLQAECTVNPAVLTGTELVKGAFDDSNSFFVDSGYNASSGTWMVAASRLAEAGQPATGINGNATAFTLRYGVQTAGDSGLNCAVLAVDADGNALDVEVVNGTLITVDDDDDDEVVVPPPPPPTPIPPTPTPVPVGASTVAGVVTYQNRATNAGITVELHQDDTQTLVDTVITGEDGAYNFAEVPLGSYRVIVKAPQHIPSLYAVEVVTDSTTVTVEQGTLRAGDVNSDGAVEIDDATFVGANFGLEIIPEIAQGDLNGDGLINITDLVLVGGNFGLVSPLPAE